MNKNNKNNNNKNNKNNNKKIDKNNNKKNNKNNNKKNNNNNKNYILNTSKPYGIYDLEGENINPLTMKPYKNLYSSETIEETGEPMTYSNLVKTRYPKLLTYKNKDSILKTISENQITLLKAGTGVGKTVIIPKIVLHALNYQKKVVCTIPKKAITRSSANYAAKTLDVKVGEEVGYFYAGDNMTKDKTKLIFATPGSIISKLTHSDPLFKRI